MKVYLVQYSTIDSLVVDAVFKEESHAKEYIESLPGPQPAHSIKEMDLIETSFKEYLDNKEKMLVTALNKLSEAELAILKEHLLKTWN